MILKSLLPGRERAPHRQSPGRPQLGSPEPSPPQPLSPARPSGHPRGRGSRARGRGRRAIGFCAALRGGTYAGCQTRANPSGSGCCAQPSLALPCPAPRRRRDVSARGSEVPLHASSAQPAPACARNVSFAPRRRFGASHFPLPPPVGRCLRSAAQRRSCGRRDHWAR